MKYTKTLFGLMCLILSFILPVSAFADFGSFSGDTDYNYDSAYELNDVEESYGEDTDEYLPATSADDASTEDMLGSLAILLVFGGSIYGIAILSNKARKRKEAKAAAEKPPRIQLENILLYSEYIDPTFDSAAFEQKLANLYVQFQNCWTEGSIESLRMYFDESLFARLERQLSSLKKKGHINHVERINVLSVGCMGYYQTATEDRIAVKVKSRIVDYTTDAAGQIISGSDTKEKFMVYEWELARPTGKTTETGSSKETNCPNCGAPFNINQSAKCPYCGTIVSTEDHDWLITAMHGQVQRTMR